MGGGDVLHELLLRPGAQYGVGLQSHVTHAQLLCGGGGRELSLGLAGLAAGFTVSVVGDEGLDGGDEARHRVRDGHEFLRSGEILQRSGHLLNGFSFNDFSSFLWDGSRDFLLETCWVGVPHHGVWLVCLVVVDHVVGQQDLVKLVGLNHLTNARLRKIHKQTLNGIFVVNVFHVHNREMLELRCVYIFVVLNYIHRNAVKSLN